MSRTRTPLLIQLLLISTQLPTTSPFYSYIEPYMYNPFASQPNHTVPVQGHNHHQHRQDLVKVEFLKLAERVKSFYELVEESLEKMLKAKVDQLKEKIHYNKLIDEAIVYKETVEARQ